MPFQKGRSGNPLGRAPKSRALTEILERAGRDKMPVAGGDEFLERRKYLARLLWDAATTGEAVLPSGEKLEFSPRDWLETVKFLYNHIDGPVKPAPAMAEAPPSALMPTQEEMGEAGRKLQAWLQQMSEEWSDSPAPPTSPTSPTTIA